MNIIADGILIIAAIAATGYCAVLSRRLARLNGLDQGLGQAIVSLSQRVDDMTAALGEAKKSAAAMSKDLETGVREAAHAAVALKSLCDRAERALEPASPRKTSTSGRADVAPASAFIPQPSAVFAPPKPSAAKSSPIAKAAKEDGANGEAACLAGSTLTKSSDELASPSANAATNARPQDAASDSPVTKQQSTSLADTLEVIRRARDSDDDEAFAARLATAISSLEPGGSAGAQ